jgi:hypothetical protein
MAWLSPPLTPRPPLFDISDMLNLMGLASDIHLNVSGCSPEMAVNMAVCQPFAICLPALEIHLFNFSPHLFHPTNLPAIVTLTA